MEGAGSIQLYRVRPRSRRGTRARAVIPGDDREEFTVQHMQLEGVAGVTPGRDATAQTDGGVLSC